MPEIYVAQALIAPRKYNMPFPVDAEIVCDAMIAADAYGRAFRKTARAQEYITR